MDRGALHYLPPLIPCFHSILAPNAALGEAITAVNKAQQDMHMPASLQAGFQGTAASFTNSLSNEPILIVAALVTVYIVLGVLYESFVHPITILSTLLLAGVGAFLALILFHQDLSVVAIIGIVPISSTIPMMATTLKSW